MPLPALHAEDDLLDRDRTTFCDEPDNLNLKGDACVASVPPLANPAERSAVWPLEAAVAWVSMPWPAKTDSGITGTGLTSADTAGAVAAVVVAVAAKNCTCGKLTLSDG